MENQRNYSKQKLKWILKQFDVQLPDDYDIRSINIGHINDTFRVKVSIGKDYLLQRKNHIVFQNVPAMMANISRVTAHLKEKQTSESHFIGIETIVPYKTKKTQKPYFIVDNEFWTLTTYISGVNHDRISNVNQALNGGRAFASFVSALDDLPGPVLYKTIPDFHHMEWRFSQFRDAISGDVKLRVQNVREEIDFFEKQIAYVMPLHEEVMRNSIPERITHNDTKINNILFDEEYHVLAIIDLDTVMPGAIHFDYGDAIRTTCNTGSESTQILELIRFNKEVFKAFTQGYLQEIGAKLTMDEKKFLPLAPFYMTYIMGIRFLTDYLAGDVYYSISKADDNLVRARSQMRYYKELKKEAAFINNFIRSF